MSWRRRVQAFVVFVGAWLGLMIYAPSAQAHDVVDGGRDWGSGVIVMLTYDQAPRPGEIVTINATVESLVDAPELTIHWQLPAGAEMIDGGPVDRFNAVEAKQTLLSVRQIRFPAEGVHPVEVTAVAHLGAEFQLMGVRTLYFTVQAGEGAVSTRNPSLKSPMGSRMPTIEVETVETADARATSDDPCFTVSGQVTRLERVPVFNAATSMWTLQDAGRVPVRFALLELRESDTLFDDSYGETTTDANGNYSFENFCDNDGFGDDHLELYVRLFAQLYADNSEDAHEVVYVTDSSWIDETYYYDSNFINSSSGGSFTRNFELNTVQSGIFNIADTILDGWNFWRASGGLADEDNDFYDHTTKIHWEIDYPDGGSYYSFTTLEITIASAGAESGDPDEWDDPVILHEFSHAIEDKYACDDSLGGPHNIGDLLDDEEFAWSEGYGNYFQSAARNWLGRANANMYVDTGSAVFNLETWHTARPDRRSVFNEGAIAAMFWDLLDSGSDDQDRVAHGHPMIQEVYTDPEFANNGWFDEDCTTAVYMTAWQTLDKPANADTAAAVVQNVADTTLPFSAVSASAEETLAAEESLAAEGIFYGPLTSAAASANKASPLDYQWWNHLILVADRSKSMEGSKFDAVKTVMQETVGDMANDTKGVEFSLYTFDNIAANNSTVVESKFYADLITPAINTLTTNSAADPNCQVNSLRALSYAIGPKMKGNAWLFTDGDPATGISVETLVGQLNNRHIKGSIALLGGCNSAPVSQPNTSGAAKNYLGKAANASQQGGIIPYLLTAIGSGGQFLFVDQSKIEDAAEIMRAQLSHSAGAGRWSDYVSNTPTYIYDTLTSWEYNWIDTSTAAGGSNRGVANPQISVPLPQAFTYYGAQQNTAHVTKYGYLTFGNQAQTGQSVNTAIPNPAVPNNALYILWEDLFWNNPPSAAAADQPAATIHPQISTRQSDGWYVIETSGDPHAFQVLLNMATGEIRYQYKTLEGNSSGATIGLENANGTAAVQVGFNDTNAAEDNMGYKFVPAPAQPTKTFTVPVDSLTPSIGFLLTGFSGTFAPLDVRTPNNQAISCADTANVTCLNLGLVQYVQVKVNGRVGVWKATVAPGNSGAGTFMFSAIGASTVTPTVMGQRAFSTGSAQSLRVILGRTVTGNQMDGWFTRPDGTPFGAAFRFYDDGQHNDGAAGDGRFGSDAFMPPAGGVAYLWLKGNADGAEFTRAEPIPFTFQPLEVTLLSSGDNYGEGTPLVFEIKNLDSVAHCYDRNAVIPAGWTARWFINLADVNGVCINAGASVTRTLNVGMDTVSPNTQPSGASGDVTVSFYEREAGQISDSATATVTRRREPAYIQINNKYTSSYLPPTGVATATLHAQIFDDQMVSVADGTVVNWSSTLGSISPAAGPTVDGRSDAIFTAGTSAGVAVVTVTVGDSLVATTTIPIHAPLPDTIDLTANKSTLPADEESAALTVTVRDGWGNPVANQSVRIGVSGDGEGGTINGSEVMTATTNANGQVNATYARGSASGPITILAQVMSEENGASYVALEDQLVIGVVGTELKIYLPSVTR